MNVVRSCSVEAKLDFWVEGIIASGKVIQDLEKIYCGKVAKYNC